MKEASGALLGKGYGEDNDPGFFTLQEALPRVRFVMDNLAYVSFHAKVAALADPILREALGRLQGALQAIHMQWYTEDERYVPPAVLEAAECRHVIRALSIALQHSSFLLAERDEHAEQCAAQLLGLWGRGFWVDVGCSCAMQAWIPASSMPVDSELLLLIISSLRFPCAQGQLSSSAATPFSSLAPSWWLVWRLARSWCSRRGRWVQGERGEGVPITALARPPLPMPAPVGNSHHPIIPPQPPHPKHPDPPLHPPPPPSASPPPHAPNYPTRPTPPPPPPSRPPQTMQVANELAGALQGLTLTPTTLDAAMESLRRNAPPSVAAPQELEDLAKAFEEMGIKSARESFLDGMAELMSQYALYKY